jgi:hypothetical protein
MIIFYPAKGTYQRNIPVKIGYPIGQGQVVIAEPENKLLNIAVHPGGRPGGQTVLKLTTCGADRVS